MQIINPYNQEVITTVETDTQTSITEKFNLAKTAQKIGQQPPLIKELR